PPYGSRSRSDFHRPAIWPRSSGSVRLRLGSGAGDLLGWGGSNPYPASHRVCSGKFSRPRRLQCDADDADRRGNRRLPPHGPAWAMASLPVRAWVRAAADTSLRFLGLLLGTMGFLAAGSPFREVPDMRRVYGAGA